MDGALRGRGRDHRPEPRRQRPLVGARQRLDDLDRCGAEMEEAEDRAARLRHRERGGDCSDCRDGNRSRERPAARGGGARARARAAASAASRSGAREAQSRGSYGLPQSVERPRRARLDGAARDVERRGGLLLGELEQVTAGEHLARVVGQLLERGEQARALFRVERRFLGGGGRLPRGSAAASTGGRGRSRRPAERRRFRASFATIWRSQGRTGSPVRKRPSARHALTSPSWVASSASAALRVMT